MQCVENIRVISKTANCHHWLYSSEFGDALRNLATIVQFKKREKHPWMTDTFRPATR